MRNRLLMAALTVTMTIVGAACGGGDDAGSTSTTAAPEKRMLVVATSAQVADFTRVLGGDHVNVFPIMGAGVDPHDYEASPSDIDAISRATLIVKNGAGLEPWFDDAVDAAGQHGTIVDASNGVTLRKETADGKEVIDPHIWHNPANAKIMVANISAALQEADPTHASDYEFSERTYTSQLDALTLEIRRSISTLTNKKLVTNHDALGYYVDAFGLTYVGSVIPSFDSQAELSSSQIADLVAKIKAEGVKAVFAESSLPPKTAETVAQEAGVKVVQGDDAIYGDSMGATDSDAATYVEMERHNTDVIVNNLR